MAKSLPPLIADGDDTKHALIELRDVAGDVVAHELVGATSDDGLMEKIGEAIKAMADNNAIWFGQSINILQFDEA